jgi:DNA-binding response OmpR family regulator
MEKILIVDDKPEYRRVLRLALGTKGYDSREAMSGADALNLMQDELFDLISVDWLMPGMDGIRLCREIRAKSSVPIIVITSKPDGCSEALAAGANDYIKKPFAIDELLVHVESALAR